MMTTDGGDTWQSALNFPTYNSVHTKQYSGTTNGNQSQSG